jgi:hypothetical protein
MSQYNPNPQPRRKTRRTLQGQKQPPPPKPSFFTAQAIKLLRFTISLLEGTVEKLETDKLATSRDGRRNPSFIDRLLLGWGSFLSKIRSLLPKSLSKKLSNTALTGLITLSLITILGINIIAYNQKVTEIASAKISTTTDSTTQNSTTQNSEITVPTQEEKTTTQEKITTPEINITQEKTFPAITETVTPSPEIVKTQEKNQPEKNQPEKNQLEKKEIIVPTQKESEVKETPLPESIEIPDNIPQNIPENIPQNKPVTPELENKIEIAPEVEKKPEDNTKKEPEKPENSDKIEKPVEEIPVPTIELTPEQKLIASIQNQIESISDRLVNEFIQSVEVNFYNSTLTLTISDDWYTFKAIEQNQLLADIFQRSKEVDFSHLEIIDSKKRLIARSPVVGEKMIIFKRENGNLANG